MDPNKYSITPHSLTRFAERFATKCDPPTLYCYLRDAISSAIPLPPEYLKSMYGKDKGFTFLGQTKLGPIILVIKPDAHNFYDGVVTTVLNPSDIEARTAPKQRKIIAKRKLVCPRCCQAHDALFSFWTNKHICYKCDMDLEVSMLEDGSYEIIGYEYPAG